MPGFGIHLIVLDKVIEKLKSNGIDEAATIIEKHKEYASLGAMGPDIYFCAPDWSDEVRDFIKLIFEAYEVLEPFIDFYNNSIKPVTDAVDSGIDWLSGGLWGDLQQTVTYLEGTVATFGAKLFTSTTHPFQYIEPNLNKGELEEKWFWIEMGHDRHTGKYASNLLDLSGANAALRAYAYGYITHITADVVGHPYVNQIVGGSFRTHWHRHHLCENYMDVWAWQHYYNANILEAKLDQRIPFSNGDLPGDLVNRIDEAFKRTYQDSPPHLPARLSQNYLSPDDINTTFRLFRKLIGISTSRGIMSLPKPVPPAVIPGLNSLITPPPSSSGSGGFSWSGIWKWIKWLFKTALKIMTLPEHVLASLATYQVRYLLYLIHLSMYQVYRALREALVLGGYVFCEPDELSSSYALEFTRQRPPAPVSRFKNQQFPYPLKEYPHTQSSDHQLNYPQSAVEFIMTESSPYTVGTRPDEFIEKAVYNPVADQLATAKSPVETQKINEDTLKSGMGQLGNAVDFAVRIITKAHNGTLNPSTDLPDWNLDSDRGYGWLNWYWEPYDKPLDKDGSALSEVIYFSKP